MKKNTPPSTAFSELCPRSFLNPPKYPCGHGMTRAEWLLENYYRTEEEEETAPGCKWGVYTPVESCYCMFKYIENDNLKHTKGEDKTRPPTTHKEIAKRLSLPVSEVINAEASALKKLKAIANDNSLHLIQYELNSIISFDDTVLDLRDFDLDSMQDLGGEIEL